jgi:hypothetical protein
MVTPAFAAPVAQSNDKKLIGAPSIRRLLTLSECRGAPFVHRSAGRGSFAPTDAKSHAAPAADLGAAAPQPHEP